MWRLLFPDRSRERGIEALARRVAELSVEAVARRVAWRSSGMSHFELRGYVRARAAAEIARQASLALRHAAGADATWRLPLITRATDRVVPLVIRHIASYGTPSPAAVRVAA